MLTVNTHKSLLQVAVTSRNYGYERNFIALR